MPSDSGYRPVPSCPAPGELDGHWPSCLPGIVEGDDRADRRLSVTWTSCLRCQPELAQYRRLLRALHQLRTGRHPTGPRRFLTGILAELTEAGERGRCVHAHRSAGRLLGGLALPRRPPVPRARSCSSPGRLAVAWASPARAGPRRVPDL